MGRLNEAGGDAGGMTQGKAFKGRQFTAEVILWAVRQRGAGISRLVLRS